MILVEESRKDVILKEAARLFRTKGYRATTMRDLADAVGIEAASLYNHISSKQEILKTLCSEVAHKHQCAMQTIRAQNRSPIVAIEELLEAHIRINTEMPETAAVAHDEWKHLDEKSKKKFVGIRDEYENELRNWIVAGMKLGEIPKNNPEIVLYTILSALQWLHHWYREERQVSAREVQSSIISLLMKGLKQ